MTLFKLAYKNMRTQFRDYFVYFISMSFSIMVYFTFISMSFNHVLRQAAEKNVKIDVLLQISSLLILFFVVLFMFYSNAFFIKKRKKEIGLYNILGMRKWQIAQLFFLENLFLGVWALIIGIILGSLLSKLFAMILLATMHLKIDIPFSLSFSAVGQTVLVFVLLFIIVAIQNASLVYRYKIVDLFRAGIVGEQLPKVTVKTVLAGCLGIVLILLGYLMALNLILLSTFFDDGSIGYSVLIIMFSIVFSVVLGTYLLFRAFLVLLITFSQSRKKFYYRNMNLVTISSLLFRLKRNANTLATIAVLSATTFCAVGGAAAVYSFAERQIDYNSSFDFSYEISNEKVKQVFEETMAKYPEFPVKSEATATVKTVFASDYSASYYQKKNQLYTYSVFSESDYNQVVATSHYGEKIHLKDSNQTYLINYFLVNYFADPVGKTINFQDDNLKLTIQGIGSEIPFGSDAVNGDVLVVTDQAFKKIVHPIDSFQRRGISLKDYPNSQKLNQSLTKNLVTYTDPVLIETTNSEIYTAPRSLFALRLPFEEGIYLSMGAIIYVAIFLGLVFMFATGSIIMLKQLAEAEEEIEHYQILKKIGVTYEEIRKSIYIQTAFVFTLPILVGAIHAFVAVHSISFVLMNAKLTLGTIVCGGFILIYFVFYLFTARAYNKIVNGRLT